MSVGLRHTFLAETHHQTRVLSRSGGPDDGRVLVEVLLSRSASPSPPSTLSSEPPAQQHSEPSFVKHAFNRDKYTQEANANASSSGRASLLSVWLLAVCARSHLLLYDAERLTLLYTCPLPRAGVISLAGYVTFPDGPASALDDSALSHLCVHLFLLQQHGRLSMLELFLSPNTSAHASPRLVATTPGSSTPATEAVSSAETSTVALHRKRRRMHGSGQGVPESSPDSVDLFADQPLAESATAQPHQSASGLCVPPIAGSPSRGTAAATAATATTSAASTSTNASTSGSADVPSSTVSRSPHHSTPRWRCVACDLDARWLVHSEAPAAPSLADTALAELTSAGCSSLPLLFVGVPPSPHSALAALPHPPAQLSVLAPPTDLQSCARLLQLCSARSPPAATAHSATRRLSAAVAPASPALTLPAHRVAPSLLALLFAAEAQPLLDEHSSLLSLLCDGRLALHAPRGVLLSDVYPVSSPTTATSPAAAPSCQRAPLTERPIALLALFERADAPLATRLLLIGALGSLHLLSESTASDPVAATATATATAATAATATTRLQCTALTMPLRLRSCAQCARHALLGLDARGRLYRVDLRSGAQGILTACPLPGPPPLLRLRVHWRVRSTQLYALSVDGLLRRLTLRKHRAPVATGDNHHQRHTVDDPLQTVQRLQQVLRPREQHLVAENALLSARLNTLSATVRAMHTRASSLAGAHLRPVGVHGQLSLSLCAHDASQPCIDTASSTCHAVATTTAESSPAAQPVTLVVQQRLGAAIASPVGLLLGSAIQPAAAQCALLSGPQPPLSGAPSLYSEHVLSAALILADQPSHSCTLPLERRRLDALSQLFPCLAAASVTTSSRHTNTLVRPVSLLDHLREQQSTLSRSARSHSAQFAYMLLVPPAQQRPPAEQPTAHQLLCLLLPPPLHAAVATTSDLSAHCTLALCGQPSALRAELQFTRRTAERSDGTSWCMLRGTVICSSALAAHRWLASSLLRAATGLQWIALPWCAHDLEDESLLRSALLSLRRQSASERDSADEIHPRLLCDAVRTDESSTISSSMVYSLARWGVRLNELHIGAFEGSTVL